MIRLSLEPVLLSTRVFMCAKVAQVLRAQHPATFAFFCRVALPYAHCEGDVHMAHVAPIFTLHPNTAEVVSFRYNETDRAPLDAWAFADVRDFYATHVRVLHGVIDSLETSFRLEQGQTLVIDNHRVMHGRHGFTGHRVLLGCYLTADDWLSRLRVLESRLASASGDSQPQ